MANAQWHGDRFKQNLANPKRAYLMKCGYFVERRAKQILTEKVYDQPQRGSYKRTGAARASIHTEFNPLETAVYVGSDWESLQKARATTGSAVFYFRYLEMGHFTRSGSWVPSRASLRPALDELRMRMKLR